MSRKVNKRGYVELFGTRFHKRGHIAEHRWLMEQWLGRPLERHEVVHHRNGVKSDNRFENLELLDCRKHIPHHRILEHPNMAAGRWSENFDSCVTCGKTEKPHAACGTCFRCYDREYQHKRRVEKGILTLGLRYQRGIWSMDRSGNIYYACTACGRTDIRPSSRGLCDTCAHRRRRKQ